MVHLSSFVHSIKVNGARDLPGDSGFLVLTKAAVQKLVPGDCEGSLRVFMEVCAK